MVEICRFLTDRVVVTQLFLLLIYGDTIISLSQCGLELWAVELDMYFTLQ